MARSRIPDPLQRRHLLERPLDAAQALRIAEAYLEDERWSEAVPFLRKAGASERLEEAVSRAIESGDVFLLKGACRALGRETEAEEWRRVAEAAESLGKLRYASTARRQLEGGE